MCLELMLYAIIQFGTYNCYSTSWICSNRISTWHRTRDDNTVVCSVSDYEFSLNDSCYNLLGLLFTLQIIIISRHGRQTHTHTHTHTHTPVENKQKYKLANNKTSTRTESTCRVHIEEIHESAHLHSLHSNQEQRPSYSSSYHAQKWWWLLTL